jgi:hypothetical protein
MHLLLDGWGCGKKSIAPSFCSGFTRLKILIWMPRPTYLRNRGPFSSIRIFRIKREGLGALDLVLGAVPQSHQSMTFLSRCSSRFKISRP